MTEYYINDEVAAREVVEYFNDTNLSVLSINDNIVTLSDNDRYIFEGKYVSTIERFRANLPKDDNTDLIFGKDKEQNIISIEIVDDKVVCYKNDATVSTRPMVYWGLTPYPTKQSTPLEGNLHYKHITKFSTKKAFSEWMNKARKLRKDVYCVWNDVESAMIYYGITLFKGMKIAELSVLAFDIEASGLVMDDTSKVFIITNTFRDTNGVTERVQFIEYDYSSQRAMIKAWCDWVIEKDPTVMTGHFIMMYDIPYLQHCYGKGGMPLGLKGKAISFNKRTSERRVDGSLSWTFKRVKCLGRHLIDGAFLTINHDIGRKYPSFGLKAIAEYEGWVKDDRVFYDAATIGDNWHIPEERKKIIEYGIHDSDDSMMVYDLMAPAMFYMSQSVTRPYQFITESASGSLINGILVRSYLQLGHSIPKASERERVAGGISWGNSGVYRNVIKWDAKSFYPSTILEFGIYDKVKDPNANYLTMVKYFTNERFAQKKRYKETGDTYYNDRQAASKVFINSAYGVFGTGGLNFNSFHNAELITKCCRQGLKKAILWATGKPIEDWFDYEEEQDFSDYSYIDKHSELSVDDMPRYDHFLAQVDTDALGFCKQDQSEWSETEMDNIRNEVNKIMYSEWEDDTHSKVLLVIKSKNYCSIEQGCDIIKKKGSSITDTKRELALREMTDEMIKVLMSVT